MDAVTEEIQKMHRFKEQRKKADAATTEFWGKNPVGKKFGKKFQIFGKQNRYTVL